MRKIKSIGFIAILVFICIGLLIPAYNYYAPATERPAYTCQEYQDDTIRIAMIGDSWVFFHYQYNDTLVDLINQKTGKPVKVSAYGLCGKTSKEIYQSFFDDQIMKALLEHGADYCFISVGINDTYKKMGARYFSKSTICILHFLLQNNIKPILMEIPNYEISCVYIRQTICRKLIRRLSMLITNSSVDCIEDYRQTLMRELCKESLDNQIIILRHTWSIGQYQTDRMHLNNIGYKALDSCISSCIITSKDSNR